MPKRICMVAYTHYRTDARPRRAAHAFVERGDRVDFFDLQGPGDPPQEEIEGVRVFHVPVNRYRGQDLTSYVKSYIRFFSTVLVRVTTRHLAGARPYDAVYVHTMPDFMVFTATFTKLLRARVVLDVHDTMPELYRSKFGAGESHPVIRALAAQEQLSCRFADKIICVHEPHRELLLSRGVDPNKILVVLNLPDPAIFGEQPCATADTPTGAAPRIVFHGTVADRLGLDVALHAFRRVRESMPSSRFEIYGTGDHAEQTRSLIEQLELASHVHFPNQRFSVDEIPNLIKGATLGVIPNRADAATAWMLPVKLLEYAYLGVPVVAPQLDTICHYFSEEQVTFFNPGSSESLAEAMLSLLQEPAKATSQAQFAQAFFEDHSWDRAKQSLYAAVDDE